MFVLCGDIKISHSFNALIIPVLKNCLPNYFFVFLSYRGLTGGFLLLRILSVAISGSPHVCFYLDLILISMFLRYCTYELGIFHANQRTMCLRNQNRTKGEGW